MILEQISISTAATLYMILLAVPILIVVHSKTNVSSSTYLIVSSSIRSTSYLS